MNASQVHDALRMPEGEGRAERYVAALTAVVESGFDDTNAANLANWATAEVVMALNKGSNNEEARQVVNGYLALSGRIPASGKQREYFALYALQAARDDLTTIERIEAALLDSEPIDAYRYAYKAEHFASFGLLDRAMRYTDIAMTAGVEARKLFYREVLASLYETNAAYKELVDAHTVRQQAMEAFFAREPDPQDFTQVIEAAEAELTREKESFRAGRVLAVVPFKDSPHRDEVDRFLRGGFDVLRRRAQTREELINECAYDALARAVARRQDPSYCELLLQEFAYVTADDEDENEELRGRPTPHYELNMVCGTIALALSALGYRGDTSVFERFFTSYEWRYKGDDFVMKTRYAVWMMTEDVQGAVGFLRDPENTSGLAYAACALADLNGVQAKQEILAAARGVTNGATLNALQEAYERLGRQEQAPRSEDRMIHLFGEMTETETVLSGGETDNQFILRQRTKTGDNTFGALVEADASALPDRAVSRAADDYRKQASHLLKNNEWAAIIANAEEWVAHTDEPLFYNVIATAHEKKRDFPKSVAWARRGLERFKGQNWLLMHLLRCDLALGQTEDAWQDWCRFRESFDWARADNDNVLQLAIAAAITTGRAKEAHTALASRMRDLSSGSYNYWFNAACLGAQAQSLKDAVYFAWQSLRNGKPREDFDTETDFDPVRDAPAFQAILTLGAAPLERSVVLTKGRQQVEIAVASTTVTVRDEQGARTEEHDNPADALTTFFSAVAEAEARGLRRPSS